MLLNYVAQVFALVCIRLWLERSSWTHSFVSPWVNWNSMIAPNLQFVEHHSEPTDQVFKSIVWLYHELLSFLLIQDFMDENIRSFKVRKKYDKNFELVPWNLNQVNDPRNIVKVSIKYFSFEVNAVNLVAFDRHGRWSFPGHYIDLVLHHVDLDALGTLHLNHHLNSWCHFLLR